MSTPDQRTVRIAERQHGLVARRQAVEAGLTRGAIQQRLRSGRWLLIAPRVFIVNGAPVTWRTDLMAACLSSDGVASHRSTATLLGLSGFAPDTPEITIRRGTSLVRPGVRVHESVDVHRAEIVRIDGIPTTTADRLAIDLGSVVPDWRYARAIDELLVRRLVTPASLLDTLIHFARRGRNGSGALRAYLDEHADDVITDSMLEQVFLRGFAPRGLPEPIAQVEVYDSIGFIARVDFAFVDEMVAMELDSRRHHGTDAAFELDREKRNRLIEAGWQVLAYTWRRVVDRPDGVYAEVERVRRAARAAPSGRRPIVRVRDQARDLPPAA